MTTEHNEQQAAPWRDHDAGIDAKALSTATEIALMWGQDRSQFISRIQVAVIDAMRWVKGSLQPAAAPARHSALTSSIAELDAFLDGDCVEPLTLAQSEAAALVLQELKRRMASTPAAPGIDLEQFRGAVEYALRRYEGEEGYPRGAARMRKLLALIDASPKGDEEQQAGAQAIAIVHMDGYRWNGKHWQKDSPKGGSEARDAARYRWLKAERIQLWSDSATGAPVSCSFDFDEPGHDIDAAIDSAMQAQAQASDAKVRS